MGRRDTMDTLPQGAFAVAVPTYNQTVPPKLYCGNAVINQDDSIVLSSYVAPPPNQTFVCTPKQIYFVGLGYQPIGGSVVYDPSNSATCDFSSGLSTITVTYNNNGTFTTAATA